MPGRRSFFEDIGENEKWISYNLKAILYERFADILLAYCELENWSLYDFDFKYL